MKYLYAFLVWLSAAAVFADGTVPLGEVYTVMFLTRAPSTAVPTALGGTPAIDVYEEGSSTPITSADGTLTTSYNSVTGLAHCELTCSSGNGFEAGKWYTAVISGTTPTVDGVSVAGTPVKTFRVVAAEAAAGQPLTTVDGANSTGLIDSAGITTAVEAADVTLAADQSAVTALGGVTITGAAFPSNPASGSIASTDFAAGAINAAALAADAVDEIITDINTWWMALDYWEWDDNGDIEKHHSATDPTNSSDPTRYSDRGGSDGEEANPN